MCTSFTIVVQEKKDKRWVSIKGLDIPDEAMPLCGCWLFDLDFKGEGWQLIKEAHNNAGYADKFEETKADAQKLNDMMRDKIFTLLEELTFDQRIIIERLV